jgi:hypothetical protein
MKRILSIILVLSIVSGMFFVIPDIDASAIGGGQPCSVGGCGGGAGQWVILTGAPGEPWAASKRMVDARRSAEGWAAWDMNRWAQRVNGLGNNFGFPDLADRCAESTIIYISAQGGSSSRASSSLASNAGVANSHNWNWFPYLPSGEFARNVEAQPGWRGGTSMIWCSAMFDEPGRINFQVHLQNVPAGMIVPTFTVSATDRHAGGTTNYSLNPTGTGANRQASIENSFNWGFGLDRWQLSINVPSGWRLVSNTVLDTGVVWTPPQNPRNISLLENAPNNDRTMRYTLEPVSNPGELRIIKNTQADEGLPPNATFNFQVTGPNGYNQNHSVSTSGSSGQTTIRNLPAGTYTITEVNIPLNWSIVGTNMRTINVVAGETASTTFTNRYTEEPEKTTGDCSGGQERWVWHEDELWIPSDYINDGRIAWRQDVLKQYPNDAPSSSSAPTYRTHRHDQIPNVPSPEQCSTTPTNGICNTTLHTWFTQAKWTQIWTAINNPNNSSSQLNSVWNDIISELTSIINESNATNPPDHNLTENNQRGLQEGALFLFRSRERRLPVSWNASRTRERDRQECRYWVIVGYSTDPTTNVRTPIWGWSAWQDTGKRSEWRLQGTPTLPVAPVIGDWLDVEYRQLLSARCHADGITAALNQSNGQLITAPEVDNQFFGMILSNPHTSISSLPFRANHPENTVSTNGGFNDTNNIAFYNQVTSCQDNIPCINDVDTDNNTAARNNLRDAHATTLPSDITRWGANINRNGQNSSTNRFTFSRDGQWNDFWIDLWRPSINTIISTSNSWRWLNAVESDANMTSRITVHQPHHSQIRLDGAGTPVGDEYLWRIESRDGSWHTSSVPHQQTITGEHTRLRTRASWASDYGNPHRMNLQWIYNGGLRTFSPTQLVGGSENNRANISSARTPTFDRNNFDIICAATFNTSNRQLSIMRWHNLFGRDQKPDNRNIVNAEFAEFTNDNRRVDIGFTRPAGE